MLVVLYITTYMYVGKSATTLYSIPTQKRAHTPVWINIKPLSPVAYGTQSLLPHFIFSLLRLYFLSAIYLHIHSPTPFIIFHY